MRLRAGRGLLYLLFLTASVLNLFGEEGEGEQLITDWFRENRESVRYDQIEDELHSLFSSAEAAQIPPELLMEKLREGAAKRIAPDRIFKALQDELQLLYTAREIISSAGFSSINRTSDNRTSELKNGLKITVIMLREGIGEKAVRELLTEAKRRGIPLASAISACSAVFHVAKITELSDTELIRLSAALYSSNLTPSNYDTVPSVFVKGRVNRLSDADILDLVESVFSRGGGLIRVERELRTRVRR